MTSNTRPAVIPAFLACVAMCLVAADPLARAHAIGGGLTPAEIDAAIRAGISGDVRPLGLYRQTQVLPTKAVGARPAALAYSPFVRVALHARAAHEKGVLLTRDDIHPGALDPAVYIGYAASACCGEIEEHLGRHTGTLRIRAVFDPTAVRTAATASRAMRDPRGTALWTRDGTAALTELGITPPEYIEAVAAFAPDVFRAAAEFHVLKRSLLDPNRGTGLFVAPLPEDVQRWR